MAKILKTNVATTKIGLNNGEIKEVETSTLDFIPIVGDEVEVYFDGDEVIIKKVVTDSNVSTPNINIINNNNNNNNNNNISSTNLDYHKIKVNKLTYLLLCMFLGVFGVHKFYAKKSGMGILYLFTCGIFGIGILVDFISAIFKESDSNGDIYL